MTERNQPELQLSVSVVIPTYNAVHTIGEQLEALAAQDYTGTFEVLVCDNGSTDGLREYVENHPAGTSLDLRWVDASDVQGASHARNVGAARACGELLAFCDADDRVHADWLRWLVDRAGTADIVSCAVETESINSRAVHNRRPLYPKDALFQARFLPFVFGAGFGIRRSLYLELEGCDESLLNGGEDVDLSWRVQLAGGSVAHEMRSVVAYRGRRTLRGLWSQTRRYGIADARLFVAYREYGMARATWRELFWTLVTLVINNPAVPQSFSKIERGRWVSLTAFLVGNVQGSLKYRVLYF